MEAIFWLLRYPKFDLTLSHKINKIIVSAGIAGIIFLVLFLHFVWYVYYINRHYYFTATTSSLTGNAAQEVIIAVHTFLTIPPEKRAEFIKGVKFDASITDQPRWKTLLDKNDTFWSMIDKFSKVPGDFLRVSYHFDNGWLNLNISRKPPVQFTSLIMMVVEFSVLLLILVYVYSIFSFTLPIRKLQSNLLSFDDGTTTKKTPVLAPNIVRETINELLKMQTRIAKFINERAIVLLQVANVLQKPIAELKQEVQEIGDLALQQKSLQDINEVEVILDEMVLFAKQTDSKMDPINITDLLKSVCENMQEVGLPVTFVGDVSVIIKGNASALQRVFNNIINNAIKYGKVAHVIITKKEKEAVIIVDDEGIGIPVKELGKVFEPFYRLEHSRSRKTGGMGLGLSIVKKIILAHHGSINLSNLPQGGLRVTVTFNV